MNYSRINIVFLKRIAPSKVALLGILLWLILYVFAAVNLKHPTTTVAVAYIVVGYLSFFLGTLVFKKPKWSRQKPFIHESKWLTKFLYWIILIALIGFVFRFVDKFLIRGLSFGGNTIENRLMLSSSGPSGISIVSAILNPFSFLPLLVYYIRGRRNILLYAICLILFFGSSLEYILLGSRSGLFVIVLFFLMYQVYFGRLRLTFSKALITISICAVFGVLLTNMFVKRTTEIFESERKAIKHILTDAGFNYTIEPSTGTVQDIIDTDIDFYQSLKLGYVNFSQYYLHGFFEFGYLYQNYDSEHFYGLYSFSVFGKFFSTLFGADIDLDKIQNSPPRVGVYSTFFGPVYIDFGWFGAFFMLFLGSAHKLLYNRVIKGKFHFLPLLFYMTIITFFMPVISFLYSAQGIYIISAFILFAGLHIIFRKKLVFRNGLDENTHLKLLK